MTASSLSPGPLCGLSLTAEILSSPLSLFVDYMRDVRALCQLRWQYTLFAHLFWHVSIVAWR